MGKVVVYPLCQESCLDPLWWLQQLSRPCGLMKRGLFHQNIDDVREAEKDEETD